MNLLAVAAGGFFGSILRYSVTIFFHKRLLGTWIANISGSALLAILFYYHSTAELSDLIWLFFGVGLCGAYTTFSTFGNETIHLIIAKQYKAAAIYVISSVLVSLVVVGIMLFLLRHDF
ncbi:fluoride efflux transporter FluC [Ornithinibacillus contaminans]|uniref:fluoride efflux transporter FluC n=1 Tax=Ornithinibacillus contaminans TaxID=694055 RepID=UPI00064DCFC5|nr:CrcB family protein [Ornithinibacillus contaminans]